MAAQRRSNQARQQPHQAPAQQAAAPAQTQALAKPANDRQPTLADLLAKMRPQIALALPKHVSPDRVMRIALTALKSTRGLADCTSQSFLGSLLQASVLGLEINTPLGHAYLIPFHERKSNTTLAQLVIGYQGMLDLARRSGMVKSIYARAVYAGDNFDFEYGLEPRLLHKPGEWTDGKRELTHVYAVARLTDGEPTFTVLTVREVEWYRERSKARDVGPWVTDYDAMAMKTAVRRLYTWLPKSAEQAQAVALDDANERETEQREQFSPEVLAVLDTLPQEPSDEQPRRRQGAALDAIVSAEKKSSPPAAQAQASRATPHAAAAQPTGDIPISSPKAAAAGLPDAPPWGKIHEELAHADEAWIGPDRLPTIMVWTPEQCRAAYDWALAFNDENVPDAKIPARPEHTIIERQPGEDD
jgi:recombination protein RecT